MQFFKHYNTYIGLNEKMYSLDTSKHRFGAHFRRLLAFFTYSNFELSTALKVSNSKGFSPFN